jgi:hypothetical protein
MLAHDANDPVVTFRQEHSVKCRSLLQHPRNSFIVTEDINSLAQKADHDILKYEVECSRQD